MKGARGPAVMSRATTPAQDALARPTMPHREPKIETSSDQRPSDDRRLSPVAPLRHQDFVHADPKLAFEDPLTGFHNRRLLDHLLDERWPQLTGVHGDLALVVIDLDDFKDVNDGYGHLTGDEVLRVTAQLLRQSFRQEDFLIRYGGDEFVVIAPGSDAARALSRARQAREALEGHSFVVKESQKPVELPVSFSAGAASFPQDGTTGEALLQAADRRLYREKRQRHAAQPDGTGPRAGRVVALVTLAVLVVFAGAALYLRDDGAGDPTITVSAMPEESLPAPAPSGPDPRELKAQIRQLENEVRALTDGPDRQRAEYEEKIRRLETRIQQLQLQLTEPGEPTAEAAIDSAPDGGMPDGGAPDGIVSVAEPDDGATVNAETVPAPPRPNEPEATAETARGLTVSQPGPTIPPRLVRFNEPFYPPIARRMRRQATVELQLVIDARGEVLSAEPIGPEVLMDFETAARQAALKALFEPGTRNGVPVEMETTLRIRFQLNE